MQLSIKFEDAELGDKALMVRAIREVAKHFDKSITMHGNARTTLTQREEIKRTPRWHGTQKALSERLGVNPKTVRKWQTRESTWDRPSGPNRGRHRVITAEQEMKIVEACAATTGTLDQRLTEARKTVYGLTRSTLYRILRSHGLGTDFQARCVVHD